MRAHAERGARIVVIGGGLLGLEAAYGLSRAGGKVTLLHLVDRLMERQLDAEGAALLASAMAERGIDRAPEQRHQGLRRQRTRSRASSFRTARSSRPISSSSPSASGPTPISPGRPASASIAASSSMTAWPATTPRSSRSANAPSIAARSMAWSSRPMSRRACWRHDSPARRRRLFRLAAGDQSQGQRRRRLLGRRFRGGRGRRDRRAARPRRRRLPQIRAARGPARRLRPRRRYARARCSISA